LHAIGWAAGVGKSVPQTHPSSHYRARLPLRSPTGGGDVMALRACGPSVVNLFVERGDCTAIGYNG